MKKAFVSIPLGSWKCNVDTILLFLFLFDGVYLPGIFTLKRPQSFPDEVNMQLFTHLGCWKLGFQCVLSVFDISKFYFSQKCSKFGKRFLENLENKRGQFCKRAGEGVLRQKTFILA